MQLHVGLGGTRSSTLPAQPGLQPGRLLWPADASATGLHFYWLSHTINPDVCGTRRKLALPSALAQHVCKLHVGPVHTTSSLQGLETDSCLQSQYSKPLRPLISLYYSKV
jgi:hypothetical protein